MPQLLTIEQFLVEISLGWGVIGVFLYTLGLLGLSYGIVMVMGTVFLLIIALRIKPWKGADWTILKEISTE